MIECFQFISNDGSVSSESEQVLLTFEQRQKSRAQSETVSGKKIGWFIERGYVLSDGDKLVAQSGEQITVVAATETLSEVTTDDHRLLTRAAYHLGNRHVPLQINVKSLRYQHDHVLDDMVKGLGLAVTCVDKPFQPESGAYHGQGNHGHGSHSHGSHSHAGHSHSHNESHDQHHDHA